MEAYRFETTVQENGVIHIPALVSLARQRIEVFVVTRPAARLETESATSIATFLDKWRGSLKDLDADELRFQYLQEKYR